MEKGEKSYEQLQEEIELLKKIIDVNNKIIGRLIDAYVRPTEQAGL